MAAVEMNNKRTYQGNNNMNSEMNNKSSEKPIQVAVTVDVSGSMEDLLPNLLRELKILVSCMQPDTVIQFNYFNMSWIPGPRMTADGLLKHGISTPSPNGGTSLYYATYKTFDLYPCSKEDPIIYIFISDGCNTERGDFLEAAKTSLSESLGTKFFLGTKEAIPESTRMGFETDMTFAFDNLSLEGAACPYSSDEELEGAACPDSDDELEGAACTYEEPPCKRAKCPPNSGILPEAFKTLVLSRLTSQAAKQGSETEESSSKRSKC
jgi:hypothetical protein